MSSPDRSAAGPAAGFHFQIQQSLLLLLNSPAGTVVSLEGADDVVTASDAAGRQHHQLKHSIRPGRLTDHGVPLWKALDGWMDVEGRPGDEDVVFRLVATHPADDTSAVAALRPATEGRDVKKADAALLAIASAAADPPANDASATQLSRLRFKNLPAPRRRQLLERIYVHDGAGDVGGLREQLRDRLETTLPRTGTELFLDQIMGWWENLSADMLMGTRDCVAKEELLEHIRAVRDTFGPHALPDLDRDLDADLTAAAVEAYTKWTFVRQLELLTLLDRRVQLAIEDYHRAYTQRSRWVKQAIVTGGELDVWEDTLIDEWKHAYLRMCDEIPAGADASARTEEGKRFFGRHSEATTTPLRSGGIQHTVLRRGTLHGLANRRAVGWHPDFEDLLDKTLDAAVEATGGS